MEVLKQYFKYIKITGALLLELVLIFALNHISRYYLEICYVFCAFLSRLIGQGLAFMFGGILIMILGVIGLVLLLFLSSYVALIISEFAKINPLKYLMPVIIVGLSAYTFLNAIENAIVYFVAFVNGGVYIFMTFQVLALIIVALLMIFAVVSKKALNCMLNYMITQLDCMLTRLA